MKDKNLDEQINSVLDSIMKSYSDYVIAKRMFDASMRSEEENKPLNKTIFANAIIVAQNALLHRAALGLTKIYENQYKDRLTLDRLFNLISKKKIGGIQKLKKMKSQIVKRAEYMELEKIRDGRIVHILPEDKQANMLINQALDALWTPTQGLIDTIREILDLEKVPAKDHARWNKAACCFWDCVFIEGKKYAKPNK